MHPPEVKLDNDRTMLPPVREMWFIICFFSLIQATATFVTRKRKGGNQSAQAALGQTCCYATEHFEIQEQRLSKAAMWKSRKKGRYRWVIVCGTFVRLNYGVAVGLFLAIFSRCTKFVWRINDEPMWSYAQNYFIFFYKNPIRSLTHIAFTTHHCCSFRYY